VPTDWLRVMLEEVAQKRSEAERERREIEQRRAADPPAPPPPPPARTAPG